MKDSKLNPYQLRFPPKIDDDDIHDEHLNRNNDGAISEEPINFMKLYSIRFSDERRSKLRASFKEGDDELDNEIESEKKGRKLRRISIISIVLLAISLVACLFLAHTYSNSENNNESNNQKLPSSKVLKSKDHLGDNYQDSNTTLHQNGQDRIFQYSNMKITSKEDDYAKYPNRDIPSTEFPLNSWQTDSEYVNNFLDSSRQLIQIAKNAIYEEYGYKMPENNEAFDMFRMHIIDEINDNVNNLREMLETGGWTTQSSYRNLQKRLLHSMFTNDKFTVVLGGDSNAAGYGNHFLQSYIMQFHTIMEPIFQKLGVQLITRNLAQTDLGTVQSSLGSQSIYGDEIDIIIYDSHNSEQQPEIVDLFYRQALIGGKRAPVLWTTWGLFHSLKYLYDKVGTDIMVFGTGLAGIPYTTENNMQNLPWAVKYLKCAPAHEKLCANHENKYRTNCWVERDDVIPLVEQEKHIHVEKNWRYKGFRDHQLIGRVLAMTILNALDQALIGWHEGTKSGHPLPDQHWHISDHYDKIRKKTINLGEGACFGLNKFMPARVCQIPMQARTEYTPRFNPEITSLTSIVKPNLQGYVPQAKGEMLYDGPDVPNSALQVPEGAIDVLSIIKNSRRLHIQSKNTLWNSQHEPTLFSTERLESEVSTSKWKIRDSLPGHCDGTSNAICGRLKSSRCLLSGHMDARGGIAGNDTSGLLKLNLENLKEGIVIIKMDIILSTDQSHDKIEGVDPLLHLPDDFEFEFSLDGIKTIWSKQDLIIHRKSPSKFVELYTLLDDEEMSKNGKTKDIELALRLHGCIGNCSLKLTHVYWA